MSRRRRNPRDPMGEEWAPELAVVVVGQHLAPQLGSDAEFLAQGHIDMRKLSIIGRADLPLLLYAYLRGRKVRTWEELHDYLLNILVSVGGRGREDIIRMEGVSRAGLPPQIVEEKEGMLSRVFRRRRET